MSGAPGSARGRSDPRWVVLDLFLKGGLPTRRLPDAAQAAGLGPRDRSLARALLAGVIRRRRTLDAIFKPYSNRRVVDPGVLWTLRLALFQRFFLDGIPVYAAYAATLDTARRRLKRGISYSNAVLRAVERGVQAEDPFCDEPAANRLSEDGRSWRFDRALFPDPAREQAYWAQAWSYPDLLVERWFREVGREQALERMRWLNATPPLALRVNTLRATVGEVQAAMGDAGIEARPGQTAGSLLIRQPTGEVRRLPGYNEGLWSVQDLAAQQVLDLAAPQPGERILDCCAAPGGKSFAAFERSKGRAVIVACDKNLHRLRQLELDRKRLGHDISHHVAEAGTSPEQLTRNWDLIILDVPCTNTAVLGRRPEARWHFSEAELRRCLAVQKQIIHATLPSLLDPHTRVLWTTCSLEPEENEQAVQMAAERGRLELKESLRLEPSEERSGAYAALLGPA